LATTATGDLASGDCILRIARWDGVVSWRLRKRDFFRIRNSALLWISLSVRLVLGRLSLILRCLRRRLLDNLRQRKDYRRAGAGAGAGHSLWDTLAVQAGKRLLAHYLGRKSTHYYEGRFAGAATLGIRSFLSIFLVYNSTLPEDVTIRLRHAPRYLYQTIDII
jgi:hypothetical protein